MKKVIEFLEKHKTIFSSPKKGMNVYIFNPKDLLDLINEPDFCQECQEIECECEKRKRK